MEKLILLVLVGMLAASTDAAKWTYKPGPYGPKNWTRVAAICGGQRQSPIDIKTSEVDKEKEKDLSILLSSAYGQQPPAGTKFFLYNNGHTVGALVKLPANSNYSIEVNNIKYVPYQAHFHWGSTNDKGSEHLKDGKAYPLEVHFIHRNTKYSDVPTALNHHDGLAVIGTFYEMGLTGNPALSELTKHFSKIVNTDTNTTIDAFKFADFFPAPLGPFYHYLGSLTTPNCQEAVHWYVMDKTLTVSAAQMSAFRSLKNTAGSPSFTIENNYRPVQPLQGRKVYMAGGASGLTGSAKDTLILATLASALAMLSTLL